MSKHFAVFLVEFNTLNPNFVAAVQRKVGGSVGFPGGKVDQGETSEQALVRECQEEGWQVLDKPFFICEGLVDGNLVAWFGSYNVHRCEPKEGDNSSPVYLSWDEVMEGRYQDPLRQHLSR